MLRQQSQIKKKLTMNEQITRKTNQEIIAEARQAFKGQWGDVLIIFILSYFVLMGVNLVTFGAISIILYVLGLVLNSSLAALISFPLFLAGLIVFFIFFGRVWNWQYAFIVKRSRGEMVSNTSLSTIFAGFTSLEEIKNSLLVKENLLQNLNASFTVFLQAIITVIGFFLLLIPGIILTYMYALVPFVYSEEPNLTPLETLKRSASIMDGYKWKLFFCYLRLLPLALLCILPCGLGLLWFIPYLSFVQAKFYDAHK